ncbi:MAG: hypothetical protein ACREMA_14980 [Longimicrobiales bacterium]
MQRLAKLLRPVALTVLISTLASACVSNNYGYRRRYYPYDWPWYYTTYGTYTTVRRPVVVVDDWTGRAFRHRPYRGYAVRRHNSPTIEYQASKGKANIEVSLIPLGDSTQIEVRARRNADAENWDQEQARDLLGRILQEYK